MSFYLLLVMWAKKIDTLTNAIFTTYQIEIYLANNQRCAFLLTYQLH